MDPLKLSSNSTRTSLPKHLYILLSRSDPHAQFPCVCKLHILIVVAFSTVAFFKEPLLRCKNDKFILYNAEELCSGI